MCAINVCKQLDCAINEYLVVQCHNCKFGSVEVACLLHDSLYTPSVVFSGVVLFLQMFTLHKINTTDNLPNG